MDKLFENQYGYFSDDGTEYVIVRPDTPKPWVNVISNGDYGLVVSQAGGGFSWRTHSNLNRLTRWQQDLVQDNWGKFLYLRDRQTGEIWSAAWQPVKHNAARYQCRHGLGYTTLAASLGDIASEWTIFVAPGDPVEIWLLSLRNGSGVRRQLSLFSYFEWCLGVAPDSHREFHKAFLETSFAPTSGILFARKRLWEVADEKGRHWNRDWPYVAFQACSEPVVDFDGDKASFLARGSDVRTPAAVANGHCSRSEGRWGDGIAALHVDVDLEPGQEQELVFLLGAADSQMQAEELVAKYRSLPTAKRALAQVREGWKGRLSRCVVSTPDRAFDILTNNWLPYQAISCRLWGRAAYYQQSGAYGFRDQLQDSLVWLPLDAAQTRQQIMLHAAHQFRDGSVYHWWHPLTEIGFRNRVSDNLLWLPFVVAEYVRETADVAVLHELVPFVDGGGPAPLWLHCWLALRRALSWRSSRGLPLIGDHDWNDGLNAVGNDMKGESVWLAHFLCAVLERFAEVATAAGKGRSFAFCRREAAKLREAIAAHAWDGEWFWRASKDNGELLGSASCAEGKIFLNAQTWAIIANSAPAELQAKAMQAVDRYLDRDYGPLLLWPAYSRPDPSIGYLSRYAPGRRENGGTYTHAATWAILAHTILGNGARAYAMYKKISPIYRSLDPDLYQAEPYVMPGNVEGPDSPLYGRGGWTWYTGSAAWLCKVSPEGILGIRPTLRGLLVDPCIPPEWEAYGVRRTFRGAEYLIQVRNPGHVSCGVGEVRIDGQPASATRLGRGILLPEFPPGSRHRIEVTLGS
ncbi:MAG: glycosyl transferase family 36 [candidate division KSB1 bacterium]|jgi:cellobiose phosphorylase|nr:glycosyl transferase family 36 [candidate division KSB1 bacterium]